MVEKLWNCQKVIDYLEINMNNLRQLQYRKTIAWVKKEGKLVFYSSDDIQAYKQKRDKRKVV